MELRNRNGFYEELWLLEHPEDKTPDFGTTPSINSCLERGCMCSCHSETTSNDNLNPANVCSGIQCYCNCHDLEVEQQILELLKNESESGIYSDEDSTQVTIESESLPSTNKTKPSRFTANKSDLLLHTISEVSLTREMEAANESRGSQFRTNGGAKVRFEVDKDESFEGDGDIGEDGDITESAPLLHKKPPLLQPVRQYSVDPSDQDPNKTVPTEHPFLNKNGRSYSRSISETLPGEESIQLVVSGKSFNLKPKNKLLSSLMSEDLHNHLDRSLPSYGVAVKQETKRPPRLVRANTVDVSPITSAKHFQQIQKQR